MIMFTIIHNLSKEIKAINMYYIYKGKDNKKMYDMNFIPSSYQSEMKLITGVIIIM